MLHVKYLFIFPLRFWQQISFLWQRNFYWLFQIKSFCKIIFGSTSDDTLVELENSVYWQTLMWYFLLFPLQLCFLLVKSDLSYLSHATSPYLHGMLIVWTSAFYLSFCCTVLPRILNILIFLNRAISIICICQCGTAKVCFDDISREFVRFSKLWVIRLYIVVWLI